MTANQGLSYQSYYINCRSQAALVELVKEGCHVKWDDLVHCVAAGKTGESAAVIMLESVARNNISSISAVLAEPIDANHKELGAVLSLGAEGAAGAGFRRKDKQTAVVRGVASGETLLHVCCRRGYVAMVALLLEYGAPTLQTDSMGCTPLQASVSAGQASVTRTIAKCFRERQRRFAKLKANGDFSGLDALSEFGEEQMQNDIHGNMDETNRKCAISEHEILRSVDLIGLETRIFLLRRHRLRWSGNL